MDKLKDKIVYLISALLSVVATLIVVFGSFLKLGQMELISGTDILLFSFKQNYFDFTEKTQILLYSIASVTSIGIVVCTVSICIHAYKEIFAFNKNMDKSLKVYNSDVVNFFVESVVFLICYLLITKDIRDANAFGIQIKTNAYYPIIFGALIIGVNFYDKFIGNENLKKGSSDKVVAAEESSVVVRPIAIKSEEICLADEIRIDYSVVLTQCDKNGTALAQIKISFKNNSLNEFEFDSSDIKFKIGNAEIQLDSNPYALKEGEKCLINFAVQVSRENISGTQERIYFLVEHISLDLFGNNIFKDDHYSLGKGYEQVFSGTVKIPLGDINNCKDY